MPSASDVEPIQRLSAHIERLAEPIPMAYREIVSDELHFDVHRVRAHGTRLARLAHSVHSHT